MSKNKGADFDYAPDEDYTRQPTQDELVRHGLKKHTETTEAVKSAEKIARASEQIAQATLIKMEDQREQMGRIKGNFNEAETKIDRSSSILSWLGRWFYCFNCCRAENPAPVGGWQRQHYQGKGMETYGMKQPDDGSQPGTDSNGAQGHAPLPGTKQTNRQYDAAGNPAQPRRPVLGNDVDGPMGDLIAQETREQDAAMDNIADAVKNMKAMSEQMNSELNRQAPLVDDMGNHADHVANRINKVNNNKIMKQFR